jgi:DNA repair exonuclease SbcCD ATPase subunit
MLRKIILVCALLLPINLLAASGTLSSSQLGELSDKNAQIKAKIKELDEVAKRLVSARAKQRSATDSIARLEEESDAALTKLERLQQIDREEPDAVAPEKLTAAKDANRKAKLALITATESRDAAVEDVKSLSNSANEKYEEFKRLENAFERDIDTEVGTQVDRQIRAMQASKEVTGFGRVSCGDDSPRMCKEKALKAAEQDASEKGTSGVSADGACAGAVLLAF